MMSSVLNVYQHGSVCEKFRGKHLVGIENVGQMISQGWTEKWVCHMHEELRP